MNAHEHPKYSFPKALLIYIVAVLFLFFEMGVQVSPSVMAFELMESFHLDAVWVLPKKRAPTAQPSIARVIKRRAP